MNKIILFDPSVCSVNAADNYLMETCYEIMAHLLPRAFFCKISTHNLLDVYAQQRIHNAALGVICGSGIISAAEPGIGEYTQWRIMSSQLSIPVTGLGIGVEKQITEFCQTAKQFYNKIFAGSLVAARGDETVAALKKIGVSAINTGCPTLWDIDYSKVRRTKSKNVIYAVNTYRRFFEQPYYKALAHEYDNVYLYCQHPGDLAVYAEIRADMELMAPANLPALLKFAQDYDCEYIGARLHAAAYLIKHGIRSALISVDARGEEVWSKIGLPTIRKIQDVSAFHASSHCRPHTTQEFNVYIWKKEMESAYC